MEQEICFDWIGKNIEKVSCFKYKDEIYEDYDELLIDCLENFSVEIENVNEEEHDACVEYFQERFEDLLNELKG